MAANRKLISNSTALAVALAYFACGPAQEQPSPRVVTGEWVAERLDSEQLVLIHVGDEAGYAAAHIPGAQHLSLQAISTPHGEGLMLEMPPVEQLDSVFESLGVSDDSRIVLYWGEDWVTPTTRIALTLDYLGMGTRTSILDGGLRGWIAEGRPTTSDASVAERGDFTPVLQANVLARIDWVRGKLSDPGVCLIDARDRRFYTGEHPGMMPRAGRIPGASSIPFTSVVEEETLVFKSDDELRQMFVRAGAEPGDTVVTYCHIGQQASLVYYVARNLGYEARMFDGSFEEWSKRDDLPVETGER